MFTVTQENPIQIIAYDLISCLGDLDERIIKLKNNQTHQNMIKMRDEIDGEYPYFKIDNTTKKHNTGAEIFYIDKAVSSVIKQSGFNNIKLSKTGIFLGSSSNDSSIIDHLGQITKSNHNKNGPSRRVGAGHLADYIQNKYNLNETSLTYNTACTSSSNALIDASTLIQSGVIDSALVIGIDLFSVVSFEGFMSMRLLSESSLKTFSEDADGIVLGEAVSAIIMSKSESKHKQKNTWYYRSGSNISENKSLTGSNPDGYGFINAINKALSYADIKASNITAIKLHGTATGHNDLAEANGIKTIYKNLNIPHLFGLKGYIGHTLGACGIAELVLFINVLNEDFIPKTLNFNPNSSHLGIHPTISNLSISHGVFLLNYVAFGGNNNTIIIEKTK